MAVESAAFLLRSRRSKKSAAGVFQKSCLSIPFWILSLKTLAVSRPFHLFLPSAGFGYTKHTGWCSRTQQEGLEESRLEQLVPLVWSELRSSAQEDRFWAVPLQVIAHRETALQDPNRIKPMDHQVFCKNTAKLCPLKILWPEKNDEQYYLYFTGGKFRCRVTMGCLQRETNWCKKCILK